MEMGDKPQFLAVLKRAFRTLRAPVPDPEVLDVWWGKLAAHTLESVVSAFSRYLDEFELAPTPAAILRLLPRTDPDRPHVDEAWTIALAARDERETVVWTDEMAQAWAIVCAQAATDETGARFGFRAAYTRLVDEARSAGVSARWQVSLGHDRDRRLEVVEEAVRAGRLAFADARSAVPSLPAPDVTGAPDTAETHHARERLRALVSSIAKAHELRLAERDIAAERAVEATAARKREIAQQANDYVVAHGIRQREPGDDDEEVAL
jgi:hypothetical protein